MTSPRIAFIGAGNMAASLIGGLRAQGIAADAIRASDPGAEQRAKISAEHGIQTFAQNAEALADADVVVLSVKPQVMQAVCRDLAAHLEHGPLIVSIAAGISCDSLQRWLGPRPQAIVRCMPNTPALLRQGISGRSSSRAPRSAPVSAIVASRRHSNSALPRVISTTAAVSGLPSSQLAQPWDSQSTAPPWVTPRWRTPLRPASCRVARAPACSISRLMRRPPGRACRRRRDG